MDVGTKDQPIEILFNSGNGFTANPSLISGSLPTVAHPQQIVIANFQGISQTGPLDVFVADTGFDQSPFPGHQQKLVEWISGKLQDVSSTALPQELTFTHRLTVGDVNGDGYLDVFYPNLNASTHPQLLINNGQGQFALNQSALPASVTGAGGLGNTGALLADVNGDGYADLVLGGWDPLQTGMHPSILYLNNGTGSFNTPTITLPAPAIPLVGTIGPVALDIKSADLTGDGKPDIVIDWTNGDYTSHYYQILINNGQGHFTDETQQRLPQVLQADFWTHHIYLADLESDGIYDLVTQPIGPGAPSPTVYVNDGTGHFAAIGTFGNPSDNIAPFVENGQTNFVGVGFNGVGNIYINDLASHVFYVLDGQTISGTVIQSGDREYVEAGGTSNNTVLNTGGSLTIQGGGAAGGGIAQLAGSSSGGVVTFATQGGMLKIKSPSAGLLSALLIAQFGAGDVLDLANVTFDSGGSATPVGGGVLDVLEGNSHYFLKFDPTQDFSGSKFALADDHNGGTEIMSGSILNVVSATTTPAAGAFLRAGQKISITLQMSENSSLGGGGLTVTGTPTLALTNGGAATYVSGASNLATGMLTFQYTAAVGQDIADLKVVGINLGVASVKDTLGNPADFSGVQNFDTGVQIDTAAPTITGATINNPPAGAKLPLGSSIEIDLAASEKVSIVGNPTLKLSDGGIATYDSGKSDLANGKIAFDYTAAAGQNTTDLKVTSLTIPSGASIKDLAGNSIVVTGAANKDLAIAVDTNAPAVSAVALVLPQPGVNALKSGDNLIIKLTLTDATVGDTLTVTGTPALALNDGGSAIYDAADSSGNVLAFKYTVGSESTTDLKINGFDFTNGNITDSAGNSAAAALSDLKLTANVFTWAHGVSGDWNTGTNWTPNGVPGANNTALITTAGTYTLSSAQNNSVGLLNMARTATLAINTNELDVTAGTGAGTLAGKITVADAATLGLGATANTTTFNNTGTVSLNSSGDNTDLIIAGNVTLLGAGKVALSDSGNNEIISNGSASTLTNGNATAGNTISGAGTIGDSHLTLSNQVKGIINGNGVSNALTLDTGAHAITNLNILEGTTAQGLVIDSNVSNSKLIEALGTNARVDLMGTITNSTAAATILASGTGAHVDLDGATIAGGTLKTTGTGAAIDVIGASTFDGSGVGAPVNNTAIVNVGNGKSLTLKGTLNNTGTVGLNSSGAETDLIISGSVALTGAGKITLTGADAELISNGSAATLTNGNATAGNTISGVGTIGDNSLSISNALKGIINASDAAGGILSIDAKSFTNTGLLEATGHGVLQLESDITSTGQVKAAVAGAHINLDNATITGGTVSTIAGAFLDSVGGASSINTPTVIANAGRLGAEGGDLTITGPVKNTGTLDANNAHLTLQGAVTGTGKTTIEGTGSVEFAAVSSTSNVTFSNGATGQLILDHSTTFKGTITGFAGPQNAFSNFFGFGDSTIDSGWFPTALKNGLTADETGSLAKNALITAAVAAGGTGTPVGLGLMNSQVLANDLGLTALPSNTPGGAGTNFAIAGATNATNSGSGIDPGNGGIGNLNPNHALPSTVTQISNYLAAHSNAADPNALFLISSGGNDITWAKDNITTPAPGHTLLETQQAYLIDQANSLATAIKALETAGAQHVLVDNNYGGGGLNNFYNSALATALTNVGATYINGNVQGVVATIKANPTLFGFTAQTVLPGDATLTAATQNSAFQPQLTPAFTPSGWVSGAPTPRRQARASPICVLPTRNSPACSRITSISRRSVRPSRPITTSPCCITRACCRRSIRSTSRMSPTTARHPEWYRPSRSSPAQPPAAP